MLEEFIRNKTMGNLNWNNLSKNRCPRCSQYLTWSKDRIYLQCDNCKFSCKAEKATEIINNIAKAKEDDGPNYAAEEDKDYNE